MNRDYERRRDLLLLHADSPPPWTPAALGASLKAWWVAGLGVTLDGGAVASWDDQSGNGNHLSQTTAGNRPTVSATPINGRTALQFSRASQQYLTTAAAIKVGAIFVVARCVSLTAPDKFGAYNGLVSGTGAGGLPHAYLLGGQATPEWYSLASPATTLRYKDGVLTDNAGLPNWHTYHVTDSNPLALGTDFRVGIDRSFPAQTWGGDIAEIIVCDAVPDAGNTAAVLAYCKARYATP